MGVPCSPPTLPVGASLRVTHRDPPNLGFPLLTLRWGSPRTPPFCGAESDCALGLPRDPLGPPQLRGGSLCPPQSHPAGGPQVEPPDTSLGSSMLTPPGFPLSWGPPQVPQQGVPMWTPLPHPQGGFPFSPPQLGVPHDPWLGFGVPQSSPGAAPRGAGVRPRPWREWGGVNELGGRGAEMGDPLSGARGRMLVLCPRSAEGQGTGTRRRGERVAPGDPALWGVGDTRGHGTVGSRWHQGMWRCGEWGDSRGRGAVGSG